MIMINNKVLTEVFIGLKVVETPPETKDPVQAFALVVNGKISSIQGNAKEVVVILTNDFTMKPDFIEYLFESAIEDYGRRVRDTTMQLVDDLLINLEAGK